MMNYRDALNTQIEKNIEGRAVNSQIKAEVVDLKTGLDEIEESARSDLGMIKEGEVFLKPWISLQIMFQSSFMVLLKNRTAHLNF